MPEKDRGLKIIESSDIISAAGIKPFLSSPGPAGEILVYPEADSTHKIAKTLASDNAGHGTVVIADRQTAGRGRYGRSFFSPPSTGLYMSFILDADNLGFNAPTAITAYAALCVCEVIESLCDVKASIKWVNDIFVDGRKVCGILTEAATAPGGGRPGVVLLGIGVNVSTRQDDFPEDVKARAGSLYPDGNPPITRNRLAAGIIDRILSPGKPTTGRMFAKYKERLFMLGADILVIQGPKQYAAKALDIDETGRLIVQEEGGGHIIKLSSGEVSIVHEAPGRPCQ